MAIWPKNSSVGNKNSCASTTGNYYALVSVREPLSLRFHTWPTTFEPISGGCGIVTLTIYLDFLVKEVMRVEIFNEVLSENIKNTHFLFEAFSLSKALSRLEG